MGDSAGGNLAAVVALETRTGGAAVDADVRPAGGPGPDLSGGGCPAGHRVPAAAGRGVLPHPGGHGAVPESAICPIRADWTAGRASPLLAEDHRGVAPALVVTAGFDPLRDDGGNYAEALRAAGVEVEYRCYDDQVHGFMGMGILSDSLALATEVCDAMGRLLRRSARELPA